MTTEDIKEMFLNNAPMTVALAALAVAAGAMWLAGKAMDQANTAHGQVGQSISVMTEVLKHQVTK